MRDVIPVAGEVLLVVCQGATSWKRRDALMGDGSPERVSRMTGEQGM